MESKVIPTYPTRWNVNYLCGSEKDKEHMLFDHLKEKQNKKKI